MTKEDLSRDKLTAIDLENEMFAYEALWHDQKMSFSKLARLCGQDAKSSLTALVSQEALEEAKKHVSELIETACLSTPFSPFTRASTLFPAQLSDAKYPLPLIYAAGNIELATSPAKVAIIGSRKASYAGISRTRRLARLLSNKGITIVSGLAKGVDTMAHRTAIENGGKTIAVIGTPITDCYPSENNELQRFIASEHLLISQIPIWRYSEQDYRKNRAFFPERNATMSALSDATVIVEAKDKSGTLTQAKSAIDQGRKLFVLDSCFLSGEAWPQQYERLGAIRVRDIEDITSAL